MGRINIDGDDNANTINGTDAAERISALGGNDLVYAGGGADLVRGGNGADTLFGGAGDDFIVGAADPDKGGDRFGDSLDGGDGADTLMATGADTALGGAGNDFIEARVLDGETTTLDGGAGSDELRFFGGSGFDIDLKALTHGGAVVIDNVTLTGFEHGNLYLGDGRVVVDDRSSFAIFTGDGADTLIGGSLDDTLFASAGDDSVVGGAGNDLLSGLGGELATTPTVLGTLLGGAGDDRLVGSELARAMGGGGDDHIDYGSNGTPGGTVDGGAGADTINCSADDALVLGGSGDDLIALRFSSATVKAGDGNDTLSAAAGTGVLVGGEGADTYVFSGIMDSRYGISHTVRDANIASIDVSGIDADRSTTTDDAFHIVDSFTRTAGELVLSYRADRDVTQVEGDVTGDGVSDFAITITGHHTDAELYVL